MQEEVATAGPAFITGGSSGIGLALATRLASRGHPLALFARDAAKLEGARAAILSRHGAANVSLFSVDVADHSASLAAFDAALAQCGTPKWAIASAGIAEPGLFLEQPLDRMQVQMDVNYGGTLRFARALAPAMAAARGGNLVLISSGAALAGIFGYAAYGASKFAVRGLAETLRVELAADGIRVTLACPPDTDTPQLAAETLLKPKVTKAITAGGGLHSADAVAQAILRGADANRFLVTPGWQMNALGRFHSLIAPAFRTWQVRVAGKIGRGR